ncbi:hypothetical protein MsAg5_15440 [Methanosarcinaceae archaeon Ag5]|uniref:Peptidase S1 domain-containing protein n=1 Tax=Methanolapillus africanus TaxID=3028297 RepID=A0AAE4MKS3_9EURY|nr:hypothetical protein [Methanosarcinaceae archaeon Ag5]
MGNPTFITPNATDSTSNIDAIFVEYSNVSASIHIGNNTIRAVNDARYQFPSNQQIHRSGIATKNTVGTYGGYWMDQIELGGDGPIVHRMDFIYQSNNSQGGDSGGPLYTIDEDNTLSICGITSQHATLDDGTPITMFVAVEEIQYQLGVMPLTRSGT